MKNKKAEQIAAKQRYIEQLKAKRRAEPNLEREEPQEKRFIFTFSK